MLHALPSSDQMKTKQDMAVLAVPAPPMLSVLVLKVPVQPER